MKIEYITKGYEIKDKLKEITEKKIARLDKFFDPNTKIKVKLKKRGKENNSETMELTIILGGLVLRSEATSANMFENIDEALPKLEKQIIRHRGKLAGLQKVSLKSIEKAVAPSLDDSIQHSVVRSKVVTLVPISVDDAVEEMELIGHPFFVFQNKESKAVNVLYVRKDGEYGLIETIIK